MQFWIIEDGEKRGPIEDYELREMIRAKKISAGTKVWYEGAEGWAAAREVTLLAGEFEEVVPPPLPVEKSAFHLWRRLGARWFDMSLYQLLLSLAFSLGGVTIAPDSDGQLSGWLIVVQFLPLVLMEGAMLNTWGATPGKMLLGLRVRQANGEKLSISMAIMRSLRVWVLGMGMAIHPIFLIVGHLVALGFGLKKGAPLWDLVPAFQVPGKKIGPAKVVVFAIAFITVISLSVWINWDLFQQAFEEAMEKAQR